jgi:hypothetical protein
MLPRPRLTLFHQPQHRRHRTLLDPQQAVRCLPLLRRDHAPHTKKPLLIEQGLPLPQRTNFAVKGQFAGGRQERPPEALVHGQHANALLGTTPEPTEAPLIRTTSEPSCLDLPDPAYLVTPRHLAGDDHARAEPRAGSAAAALAMVSKLVESAQQRWRAVNAPHLVALVRAGARFERGHLVERTETHAA